jgi:hypothetical protein
MKKALLFITFLMLLSINIVLGQGTLGVNLNTEIAQENPKHSKDLPNNGISSPMHKKYMGKVVFSKKEAALNFEKEIESDFETKFTLGDAIYLRVYMDNSLANYVNRLYKGDFNKSSLIYEAVYYFKFYVDGIPIFIGRYGQNGIGTFVQEQKQTLTTYRGCFYKDGGYTGIVLFKDFLAKAEDKLTVGDHKIKVEVYPRDDYFAYKNPIYNKLAPMVASGEFTLTFAGVNSNDESMCLPKAKMQDKTVEAGMLKAFNSSGSRGEGKVAKITVGTWNIVRNENSGIILRRSIGGAIGFTKDGKCKYQEFDFSQDHDGSKFLDEVYIRGIGGTTDINCGCFK